MTKSSLSFQVEDISQLAKSLKKSAGQGDMSPSHVEWLNILARAAGFRNYQHFKANHDAEKRLAATQTIEPIDHVLIEHTLRHIDEEARLVRWPSRPTQRNLCLWWLWSLFPANAALTEKEVNALLKARNSFEDHALLRRALVDGGFVARTPDGTAYRRKEMPPTATARTFLALMKLKRTQTAQQH